MSSFFVKVIECGIFCVFVCCKCKVEDKFFDILILKDYIVCLVDKKWLCLRVWRLYV